MKCGVEMFSYSRTFGIGSCVVLVETKEKLRPITWSVFLSRIHTNFWIFVFACQGLFLERETYMSRSQWESYWSWIVSGVNRE